MESISMHHENHNSKLRNLVLSTAIVSLFTMAPQANATKRHSSEQKQGFELYTDTPNPLNFTQTHVNTYFPWREAYFADIFTVIEKNPELKNQMNIIIQNTIMKKKLVNKDISPRIKSEKDKVCGVLMFIEWLTQQNTFALQYSYQEDQDIGYEQKCKIQQTITAETVQDVLDADQQYTTLINQYNIQQQESDKTTENR